MPDLVPLALAAWVVACVALFARLPGRDAALIAMVGGWAVLPTASYPPSAFAAAAPEGFGGSMHAVALPAATLASKATAIGLGCLAGALLFDWRSLRRVRPSWADLPMAAWCVVPTASALSNGLPLSGGLAQAGYLVLAWGVPYLLGRAYLADSDGLARFGRAWVLAGVAYVPVCLAEFAAGPFLYHRAYGPHPYEFDGAARVLVWRPLGMMEQGNQLGMWAATAAVAAVWLWRSGRLPRVAGLPGGAVAGALAAVCLVCQSLGAAVLMALASALPLLRRAPRAVRRPAVLVASAVLAVALAAAAAVAVKAGTGGGARELVRSAFGRVGKGSFVWRLGRYEDNLPRLAARPVLGWGRADWSAAPDGRFSDPVAQGLWCMAAGAYGAVGAASLYAALTVPAVAALRRLPSRAWLSPSGSAVALAAALLAINLVDSLLNSTWIVPLTAGAGGLNSWALRKRGAAETFA
jgi:hypothetical protein